LAAESNRNTERHGKSRSLNRPANDAVRDDRIRRGEIRQGIEATAGPSPPSAKKRGWVRDDKIRRGGARQEKHSNSRSLTAIREERGWVRDDNVRGRT
jgi:hypothetical protein